MVGKDENGLYVNLLLFQEDFDNEICIKNLFYSRPAFSPVFNPRQPHKKTYLTAQGQVNA